MLTKGREVRRRNVAPYQIVVLRRIVFATPDASDYPWLLVLSRLPRGHGAGKVAQGYPRVCGVMQGPGHARSPNAGIVRVTWTSNGSFGNLTYVSHAVETVDPECAGFRRNGWTAYSQESALPSAPEPGHWRPVRNTQRDFRTFGCFSRVSWRHRRRPSKNARTQTASPWRPLGQRAIKQVGDSHGTGTRLRSIRAS